jgi:hypothetical protein
MAAWAMKEAKFSMTPVPHPPARMHWAAAALSMPANVSPAAMATGTSLLMLPSP